MNLDDLDIFRCVVREGGVMRAADRLNRVPSNVTTRIKQFEERLGVALFRRQGRGLALTEAGRTMLGHAERLLQMADLAVQELQGGAVRGVLRLNLRALRAQGCRQSFQRFMPHIRTFLLYSYRPARHAHCCACWMHSRSRLPSCQSPSRRQVFPRTPPLKRNWC